MKVRTYITKSKAGHYTVTVKEMKPWGVMGTAGKYCHFYIDSLQEARRLAAEAKAAYKEMES